MTGQGALDVKYLEQRFVRGKKAVADLCEKHQKYIQLESGVDMQNQLLSWQQSDANSMNPFLRCIMRNGSGC